MEKVAQGTKGKIVAINGGEFVKSFIGQQVTATEHMGRSGETQMFTMNTCAGLYLSRDQIELAA